MNRRDFHKLSFGAAAAAMLPSTNLFAEPANTVVANGGHKFSVMLWTMDNKLPFEEKLRRVAEAGYTGAEVGNEYEKWTPAEWKTAMAAKEKYGITIDSAVPGRNALSDHSKRDALTADIKKAIPGAKQLGCNQFIYTAYTRVPEQTPEQRRDAIVDTLKYAADLVAKDDIEIVLEPIDWLEYKQEAVPSVADAFEITRLVGSPKVKVLYDFYHEQKQAGNLIEKLTKNIDQVGLVHIADVPGRHEPGTGEVFYTNIYKELARLKYDRYICMEFTPSAGKEWVPTLSKAREEAIAAMKSV
jgi:hydroxypyruvate isomerase